MRVHKKVSVLPVKRHSPTITPKMASGMKAMLLLGINQHDIAAYYGVNQGRVSEVNTGMKFPGIGPDQGDLFD